jgi:hypothetical protein
MTDEILPIAIAYSVTEAHIIVSMLASYGIKAHALDLHTVNTDPGLMFAVGGIRICVARLDAKVAHELVWAGQEEDAKVPPIRPYSPNLWLNAAMVIVLAAFGVPPPMRLKLQRP